MSFSSPLIAAVCPCTLFPFNAVLLCTPSPYVHPHPVHTLTLYTPSPCTPLRRDNYPPINKHTVHEYIFFFVFLLLIFSISSFLSLSLPPLNLSFLSQSLFSYQLFSFSPFSPLISLLHFPFFFPPLTPLFSLSEPLLNSLPSCLASSSTPLFFPPFLCTTPSGACHTSSSTLPKCLHKT